jgi:hypothetical protein
MKRRHLPESFVRPLRASIGPCPIPWSFMKVTRFRTHPRTHGVRAAGTLRGTRRNRGERARDYALSSRRDRLPDMKAAMPTCRHQQP